MKKSKCSKRAHLWFNPLSLMACLIMIAPKDGIYIYKKKNHVYAMHMYSLLHIAIQTIETIYNTCD